MGSGALRGALVCVLACAVLLAAAAPALARPHPGYRVPVDTPFVGSKATHPNSSTQASTQACAASCMLSPSRR